MIEEGFQALKDGDYPRAAHLLGQAAEKARYASDLVNHGYTIALHKLGERERLADVAFRVGMSVVAEDPASAMDYFQRALRSGLDSSRTRQIGELLEKGSRQHVRSTLAAPVSHVGHVVESLVPDDPDSDYIKILLRSLKARGIQSTVFTTEASASWFFNPAAVPNSHGDMSGVVETALQVGSVHGDFIERASRIADSIRNSGVQVAFFYGNLSDQIAAHVAAGRTVPLQANVNLQGEMDADLFDGRIHLEQDSLAKSRYPKVLSHWIPPSSDLEARLQTENFQTRQALGIESASTVSASFSGLRRDQSNGFVKVVIEILRRFPNHFHLFAGVSEVRSIRALLHSQGVLPRVRFMGNVADTTQLLGAIDVYMAPFPDTTRTSILEAMASGKPVLAMRHPDPSEFNSAADLVAERELTPRTVGEYVQAADRLIRDRDVRSQLGDAVHSRYRSEFTPDRLSQRYVAFIDELVDR